MSEDRVRSTIGECAIGLTRHVMECDALSHDEAYRRVLASELFKLIGDADTRLYLEPNTELIRLFDIERASGVDALYDAVSCG